MVSLIQAVPGFLILVFFLLLLGVPVELIIYGPIVILGIAIFFRVLHFIVRIFRAIRWGKVLLWGGVLIFATSTGHPVEVMVLILIIFGMANIFEAIRNRVGSAISVNSPSTFEIMVFEPRQGKRRWPFVFQRKSDRANEMEGERLLSGVPTRGLIIRSEPIEKILRGDKQWEMRSRNTRFREPIALIKKGTGEIYGTARIVNSLGPLSDKEMYRSTSKHRMSKKAIKSGESAKWRYAWVLDDIRVLKRPVPYIQKSGAVTFVTLDGMSRESLAVQLSR